MMTPEEIEAMLAEMHKLGLIVYENGSILLTEKGVERAEKAFKENGKNPLFQAIGRGDVKAARMLFDEYKDVPRDA